VKREKLFSFPQHVAELQPGRPERRGVGGAGASARDCIIVKRCDSVAEDVPAVFHLHRVDTCVVENIVRCNRAVVGDVSVCVCMCVCVCV
jgi:hypothetical protein